MFMCASANSAAEMNPARSGPAIVSYLLQKIDLQQSSSQTGPYIPPRKRTAHSDPEKSSSDICTIVLLTNSCDSTLKNVAIGMTQSVINIHMKNVPALIRRKPRSSRNPSFFTRTYISPGIRNDSCEDTSCISTGGFIPFCASTE